MAFPKKLLETAAFPPCLCAINLLTQFTVGLESTKWLLCLWNPIPVSQGNEFDSPACLWVLPYASYCRPQTADPPTLLKTSAQRGFAQGKFPFLQSTPASSESMFYGLEALMVEMVYGPHMVQTCNHSNAVQHLCNNCGSFTLWEDDLHSLSTPFPCQSLPANMQQQNCCLQIQEWLYRLQI